ERGDAALLILSVPDAALPAAAVRQEAQGGGTRELRGVPGRLPCGCQAPGPAPWSWAGCSRQGAQRCPPRRWFAAARGIGEPRQAGSGCRPDRGRPLVVAAYRER